MSLCIVDYIGDFIYHELLPRQPNLLVVCHEACLAPDSLRLTLIQDPNFDCLVQGGLFMHRVPSDLQRGCVIGSVFSKFPNCKLYTSRRDLYLSLMPPVCLEFLKEALIPSNNSNFGAKGQNLNKKLSDKFEEVYEETLQKFAKTILNEKHLRTNKSNSLKGQVKNLAAGILSHIMKSSSINENIDLDMVTETILQDLENEGLIRIAAGKVEYSDSIIESYFGLNKTKIFIPLRRKTEFLQAGNKIPSQSASPYNVFNKEPSYPAFTQPSFQEKQNSSTIPPSFSPISNEVIRNISPNKDLFPKIEQITLQGTDNSKPFASSTPWHESNNTLTPKPAAAPTYTNWPQIDHEINELIIDELFKTEVSSLLKLFTVCNRTTRDYLNRKGLQASDSEMSERINKSLKFSLEAFYDAESPKSIEELIANIKTNGLIKLKKKA